MAVYKIEYDYSPELIKHIADGMERTTDRILIEKIVTIFQEAGLMVKVKHLFPETKNAYCESVVVERGKYVRNERLDHKKV